MFLNSVLKLFISTVQGKKGKKVKTKISLLN